MPPPGDHGALVKRFTNAPAAKKPLVKSFPKLPPKPAWPANVDEVPLAVPRTGRALTASRARLGNTALKLTGPLSEPGNTEQTLTPA